MVNALADSGFVYAVLDSSDDYHLPATNALAISGQRVFLPTITLPEIAFLVQRNVGSTQVAHAIHALRQPPWSWIDAIPADYDRAAEIIIKYPDAKLGSVDI